MWGHICGNEDKKRDLKGISAARTRSGDINDERERDKDDTV